RVLGTRPHSAHAVAALAFKARGSAQDRRAHVGLSHLLRIRRLGRRHRFFTLSLKYGNPTVVNVILNIQPVISTLGAFFLFGDRLTRASSFTQASPFWRESFCQSSIPRPSENLSRKRD